jgi:glycosyltransferase involved in cell wall biosynthesis
VLLTVSGPINPDVRQEVAAGRRPRADYLELAEAFPADLLDHTEARRTSWFGRVLGRVAGDDVLLAWACFRRRRSYDVVFTDGEQVGMPLAALLWLCRRRPTHVMIVHILSPRKKTVPFRVLRLAKRVDLMFTYASAQRRLIVERLGGRSDQVVLTPFMVDTRYFAPDAVATVARPANGRPLVCSAGLEFRDYPTLVEAARGLDADVVLAAASPWSRRRDSSAGVDLPDNVEVRRLGFADLRTLYADADVVVVPVVETDFQAGITTILEAMAMGKPVICTRTTGQIDTIVDGETGIYVPPGDPVALRGAIERLLSDPDLAGRLGAAARRWAVEHADVAVYARRLAGHVDTVAGGGGAA